LGIFQADLKSCLFGASGLPEFSTIAARVGRHGQGTGAPPQSIFSDFSQGTPETLTHGMPPA
jgi:hypothetical protein